jgi:xanthine dehydrogenase accessory factor
MRFWLAPLAEALARGEAAALVHVVDLKGSAPREVGAQMLVTETGLHGSVGGGELERSAILKARESLASARAALEVYALGPDLNQCCGGRVTLAFEPFAPADLAWVRKLLAAAGEPEPLFRKVRLEQGGRLQRDWYFGEPGADYAAATSSRRVSAQPSSPRGESVAGPRDRLGEGFLGVRDPADCPSPSPSPQGGGERRQPIYGAAAVDIEERINALSQSLWLFGAGHVGRAVANALQPLGFALTWIDGRAGQFPEPSPEGVRTLALAMPELIVDEAPADTIFLVLTHSHSLDEAICEAVLRRGDFAYLGLIGSATKRARFRRRLSGMGLSEDVLDRMTCPIGLPGIKSKDPAVIAASVAADLLLRRELVSAPASVGAPRGR